VTYELFTDGKSRGCGVLSVERDGEARFWSGDGGTNSRQISAMVRCRLEFAAANGICLSGFAVTGQDKRGMPTYQHVEWWLVYVETKP
jgi:hypothetical protein